MLCVAALMSIVGCLAAWLGKTGWVPRWKRHGWDTGSRSFLLSSVLDERSALRTMEPLAAFAMAALSLVTSLPWDTPEPFAPWWHHFGWFVPTLSKVVGSGPGATGVVVTLPATAYGEYLPSWFSTAAGFWCAWALPCIAALGMTLHARRYDWPETGTYRAMQEAGARAVAEARGDMTFNRVSEVRVVHE